MTPQEKIRVLDELMESPAWGLLEATMQDEILNAAYQLSANKPITADELHFKRGAIWAARRMIELPNQMKTLINNELIMQMAQVDENSSQP